MTNCKGDLALLVSRLWEQGHWIIQRPRLDAVFTFDSLHLTAASGQNMSQMLARFRLEAM